MFKLCSKCKKRPAVVFLSDPSNQSGQPQGLCINCAKELGIKPVDDMLKNMNLSEEDIDQMNEQFMDLMELSDSEDGFEFGGAQTFPFLNNIFGYNHSIIR